MLHERIPERYTELIFSTDKMTEWYSVKAESVVLLKCVYTCAKSAIVTNM